MNGKSSKTAKQTKPTGKMVNSENLLATKLNTIAIQLDDEGLNFLVKQAETLLHNQQVKKQIEEARSKPNISSPNTAVKKENIKASHKIEIIEKEGSSSFILVIDNNRKFLTLEEMRNIVKVCHTASDKTDAAKRLFVWIKNNRSDISYDADIDSYLHPSLGLLYNEIISRYTVKK